MSRGLLSPMALELKVPEVGESITEVMIGTWKKQEGDAVAADESIVEIESDKATVELPAPVAGSITKILKGAIDDDLSLFLCFIRIGLAAQDVADV